MFFFGVLFLCYDEIFFSLLTPNILIEWKNTCKDKTGRNQWSTTKSFFTVIFFQEKINLKWNWMWLHYCSISNFSWSWWLSTLAYWLCLNKYDRFETCFNDFTIWFCFVEIFKICLHFSQSSKSRSVHLFF